MATPIMIGVGGGPAPAIGAAAAPATPAAASAAPAKAKYFPEPLIGLSNFQDWGQACRVRQIQDKYDEMLEKAADENLTLDQYMLKNGLKDHTALLLSCPQYPMNCWPIQIAELGSGFVLYFHFLVFLGCFLFFSFVVQVPAIMEYWDKDNFLMWKLKAGVIAKETEMLSGFFLYTSPGMLGPKMSEAGQVPLCYFALVCVLCGAVVAKSAWQIRVDNVVDSGTTQPNDFAIMVEGLPQTATDELAIMNFFKENAIRGKNDTEIVKVVIGWDAKEYREKMRELKRLKVELAKLPPDHGMVDAINDQVEKINTELMSTAPDTAARLTSSGVVVVSFRYQTDLRRCLDRWQSLWATWAYRDWGAWCGLCGGPELPRFPTAAGIGVWRIKVNRAPNPGDINWDDLGVPRKERLRRMLFTNGAMLLIIGATFGVSYAMVKIKEDSNSTWTSVLPAFGIAFANMAVMFSAKYFGEKEYHNTVTGQEGSQALKMTIGLIVNTALVMLVLNRKDFEWYKKAGLVSDMLMLIGMTAVIQPLFQMLDIKYSAFGKWARSKYNAGTIERLRAGAEWYNTNGVTKATADDFKGFRAEYNRTVGFFNAAWEPSEMDMKRRYAYAVRTFVCCMAYCHLIPFISLIGIAGITMQYWVDKRLLLRWYKRSAIPKGKDQATMSLYFLRFTTLLMPLCMWFFISPSFHDTERITYWMALSYLPACVLCIAPLSTIRAVLCAPCRGRDRARVAADDKEDYYTAQYMWPASMKYHKSHNLYKCLPPDKNPEFLDEHIISVMKADDVKASYGASAAAASAAATAVKTGTAAVSGTDLGGAGVPVVVAAAAAVTLLPGYGVSDAGGGLDPPPVTGGGASGGYGASAAGASAASLPSSGGGGGGRKGGPLWEMEIGKGWSKFDEDCLGHLEKTYQTYKNGGGDARITVRTKGMVLSVDFEKMTQIRKGKGKNKVIKIRRSEGP